MDDFMTNCPNILDPDSLTDVPPTDATYWIGENDPLADPATDWTGMTDLGFQSDLDLNPLPAVDIEWPLEPNPVSLGIDQDLLVHPDAPVESAEPKFGISMSAGQTDSGDARIWSTANNAGGGYYNARTGQPTK